MWGNWSTAAGWRKSVHNFVKNPAVRSAFVVVGGFLLIIAIILTIEEAKRTPTFNIRILDSPTITMDHDYLATQLQEAYFFNEFPRESDNDTTANDTAAAALNITANQDEGIGDTAKVARGGPFQTSLRQLVSLYSGRENNQTIRNYFKDWKQGRLCDAAIRVTSYRWPSRIFELDSNYYCVYPVALV